MYPLCTEVGELDARAHLRNQEAVRAGGRGEPAGLLGTRVERLPTRIRSAPLPPVAGSQAWRSESDDVAVRVGVNAFVHSPRHICWLVGRTTDAGPRPCFVEGLGVLDGQVRDGHAVIGVVAARPIGEMQVYRAAFGEAILVAVFIRRDAEAESAVMIEGSPYVCDREDRRDVHEFRWCRHAPSIQAVHPDRQAGFERI
jgi:hypothetical protein